MSDHNRYEDPVVGATDAELADPHGLEAVEDFDQFWRERDRQGRKVRIMGEVIELPPAMPLQFEMAAKRTQNSQSDKDVRKLVAILFGDDKVSVWAEKGMDAEQFAVLLMWATVNIAGQEMSFEEAAVAYHEHEQGGDDGNPTRQQRRAKNKSSGKRSYHGGR